MKSLNDYFEHIYCVNLDRRTDRWELCKQEFDKHNIRVNRWSACDGKTLSTTQFPQLNSFETVGQLGCLLSQYELLKEAKDKNFSSILIMEDDVVFCDNFNDELNKKMVDIPDDWDMIFFGANHIIRPTRIADNVYKINRAYSAHCYVVKSTIYDNLLEVLSQLNTPLDVIYANIQPLLNAYVFNPHLVWQRPGYSDICEQNVDYTHVHKISL